MIEVLIIWIGAILPQEEALVKYLICNGRQTQIDFGLLTYDDIEEALLDMNIIDNEKYKYYFVVGDDKIKIERMLPPGKLLGFSIRENYDLKDKRILICAKRWEEHYNILWRIAEEGDCASVTFVRGRDALTLPDYARAQVIIDEEDILRYEQKGAFIINKIKKENERNGTSSN